MPQVLTIAAVSYLLGSIPFGYLLVLLVRGQDVRTTGSGNIGATNVSRTSPALGVLTLLLDAAKGFLPVQFALWRSGPAVDATALHRAMALAALFAIVGHMFPVWLKFRGGKGVATALGAFLRLSPLAVAIAALIFVVIVFISRRISVGSVITAAAFPIIIWFDHASHDPQTLALITAAALLIIVKHRQNIRRIMSGTEPRFSLGKKTGTKK